MALAFAILLLSASHGWGMRTKTNRFESSVDCEALTSYEQCNDSTQIKCPTECVELAKALPDHFVLKRFGKEVAAKKAAATKAADKKGAAKVAAAEEAVAKEAAAPTKKAAATKAADKKGAAKVAVAEEAVAKEAAAPTKKATATKAADKKGAAKAAPPEEAVAKEAAAPTKKATATKAADKKGAAKVAAAEGAVAKEAAAPTKKAAATKGGAKVAVAEQTVAKEAAAPTSAASGVGEGVAGAASSSRSRVSPAQRAKKQRRRASGTVPVAPAAEDDFDYGTSGSIVLLKSSGFGFIKPDTSNDDNHNLYFHVSGVAGGTSFSSFRMGDRVNYDVGIDEIRNQTIAKQVDFDYGTSGTIVQLKNYYNRRVQYGFIKPDTSKVDNHNLFFNVSGVAGGSSFNSFRTGDRVKYEVGVDERRNQTIAKQVVFDYGTNGTIVLMKSSGPVRYGFIKPDTNNDDNHNLYLPMSGVAVGTSFDSFRTGDRVKYEVGLNKHQDLTFAKQVDFDYGTSGTMVHLKRSGPAGYGLIKPDTINDDNHNLYFPMSGVAVGTSFDSFRTGDRVKYEVGLNKRRDQTIAKQVKFETTPESPL